MTTLLQTIQELARAGNLRVSTHGFEALSDDDISFIEILETLAQAVVVEEYPEYHKGPCVLVLQTLADGRVAHALWGLAASAPDSATLITAYLPDPARWSSDFLKRKPK